MDFQDRTLADIAAEIRVRKVKTGRDAIEVGALLTEAKAQLRHGRWLPWLQQEFGYSPRTAQNYLRAFKFARDRENVAHLNLSPAILYRLAGTRQQGKPPKIALPSQPPGS